MSRGGAGGWRGPIGALALLWTLAFALACRLAPASIRGMAEDETVVERVLGASRAAFSQGFMEQADNFFHLGVPHLQHPAFSNSVLQAWAEQIRPSGHKHTEGADVREIMPWLRMATRMDPHNVEAYLTTAYWLRTAIARPDLAEEVLLEAQRNNPDDYRVLSERARLLFGRREDGRAASLLEAGIRLWPSGLDATDGQRQIELSQMLTYRAFLYELEDQPKKALEYFRKASALFPDNAALAARVRDMERGKDISKQDRASWEGIFVTKMTCAREEHGGAGDPGHDHDHEHEHEHGE